MEPFPVTCETCHARLKVRSASAIGEIHSCPRCGSMVHIALPVGWGAAASAVSQAKPQAAVAGEQFTHVATPSQAAADAFAEAAVAALETAASSHAATAAAADAPVTISPAAATPLAAVRDAAAKLASASGGVKVAAGVAAVLLLGGLMLAVWPDNGASEEIAPSVVAQVEIPKTVAPAAASPAAVPAEEPAPAVSTNALARQEPRPPDSPAVTEVPRPAEVVNDAPPPVVATKQIEVAPSNPPAPHVEPKTTRRDPILKIDPLDPLALDPSRLTFSTETAATPSSQDNANGLSAATQATAGEAASARRSSSQAAAGETAPASPPVKQAPAIADNNPTISIRRGPAATDAPVPQNVDAQLALPIQSLSMRAVPLATLIDSLADMSGVPMTIDPTALEIIGLSPRREVTLDVKSVTIEQALRTALASQRLDIAVRDGKVVVVGPAADAKRPRDYDVTDLAAGDVTKAALLAEQIQRFVAVESWEPSGGAGNISANGTTLHIEQADREHIRVLVFLERLRLARGLPLVSRYPAERLTNESTYGQLAGKLRRPTTFTYVPWTRLADVVRDWQRQSDVTMLVDWKRLAEVELEPSSPISCSVIHRTWEEALDGILEPLGLAWWAIDGETIQITSRKAADGLQRIEFFAIPLALREKYAGDEALIEAIRRELVERGQATVQVDIDGDRLIVLGNATAHRYLERRVGK